VAGHVAERAGAEIVEAAPLEGVVGTVLVGAERRGAQPALPVQRRRHRVGTFGTGNALRPDRAVGPHVHLGHVAENAGLQQLGITAQAVVGAALVAHLRDHATRVGDLLEILRLPDRAHQRLLHINVAALLHRADRGGRMHVVRRRDRDRVEILALVQHLAEIAVALHLRRILPLLLDLGERLIDRGAVHVAQRDNVLAVLKHRHPVAPAFAADADHADVQFFARLGERACGPRREAAPRCHGSDRTGTALDEIATIELHHDPFPSLMVSPGCPFTQPENSC